MNESMGCWFVIIGGYNCTPLLIIDSCLFRDFLGSHACISHTGVAASFYSRRCSVVLCSKFTG